MSRRALLLALAVAIIGVAATSHDGVSAHAALRASEPPANSFLRQPPKEIILDFTEPIDNRTSTIRLLDGAGADIAVGPTVVTNARMRASLPTLAPGIYNVVWANVSLIDGHALSGSYPFTVLNLDGSVPETSSAVGGSSSDADRAGRADGTAVRFLSLLGLVLAVGGSTVSLLWPEAPSGVRRWLGQTVMLGAIASLAGAALALALLLETYSMLTTVEAVLDTRFGRYWLARLLLAGLVLGSAVAWTRRPRWAAVVAVAAGGGQLWTLTATSHAAAVPGSNWAMMVDLAHAAAAVTWLGSVAGAVVAARFGQRRGPWRPLMRRFTRLASTCVYVLLASGLLATFVHVDSAAKLTETRYGVILLAKMVLVVPLLAVGLYNARRGRVRLMEERQGEPRRFMYGAATELAAGLAVVALAALLSQTTTSRSIVVEPERFPFRMTAPANDLQVTLNIDPNQTGLNTFEVSLRDASGQPAKAQEVRLVFRYQEDRTLGPSTFALAAAGAPGTFRGEGPYMPLEGRWRVEVEVRRLDGDDARTFFDVRPSGAFAGGTGRSGGPWALPAAGISGNQFGGMAVLLAGLGLAFARGWARAIHYRLEWATNAGTLAGVGLGTLLLFGVHTHEPQVDMPTNPIFPDADSIARGRALYVANCVNCHGRTGVPPPGLDLQPYPLDLTIHVPQHPDGQLFRFIADGIPGTAMPSWREQGLSDDEIWHLVNYLRTLAPVTQ